MRSSRPALLRLRPTLLVLALLVASIAPQSAAAQPAEPAPPAPAFPGAAALARSVIRLTTNETGAVSSEDSGGDEDGDIDPAPSLGPNPFLPLPATPPPQRPPPLPLPKSGTYVLINFSWPLPSSPLSPGSAVAANPFRADLDAAVVIPATGAAFGPGCPTTWAAPHAVAFSGDAPFAPGWEAFRIALPLPLPPGGLPASPLLDPSPAPDPDEGPEASAAPSADPARSTRLLLAARWFSAAPARAADAPVEIAVTAFRDGVPVQAASVRAPVVDNTRSCAYDGFGPRGVVASLDISLPLVNAPEQATPRFVLERVVQPMESMEPDINPSPAAELLPTAEPTEDASPEPSTAELEPPVLALRFAWRNNRTDVEAGISLPFLGGNDDGPVSSSSSSSNSSSNSSSGGSGSSNSSAISTPRSFFGANCRSRRAPDIVRYSGNNFNTDGTETLSVSLSAARAEGLFTRFTTASGAVERLAIPLLADWWSTYVPPSDSSVNVTATLVTGDVGGFGSGGGGDDSPVASPDGVGEAAVEAGAEGSVDLGTIEVFPGRSTGCVKRRVGTAAVTYDAAKDAYSVRLSAFAPPDEGEFELPSAVPEPDESAPPEEYPAQSPFAEASAEPEPEMSPSMDPFLSRGPGLRITFAWPPTEFDLDSDVRVGSGSFRTSFGASTWFIESSGEDTSFGGAERFLVRLDDARAAGLWLDVIEVDLFAVWYSRERYTAGLASVAVELVDEDGAAVDDGSATKTALFNPVLEWRSGSAPNSKVGKVRVKRGIDAVDRFELFVYARNDTS